jgi:hypothetical protein
MTETLQAETKSLPNYKDLVRVLIINDNETTITGTLGITEERSEILDRLIKDQFVGTERTITDMMVKVSNELLHPNELAYCIYNIGTTVGREKAMMALFEEDLEEM